MESRWSSSICSAARQALSRMKSFGDLCATPAGVDWRHLAGGACLAGIGFTMSIFMATLAFPAGSPTVEAAKLGIILASLVSGALGVLVLWRKPPGS